MMGDNIITESTFFVLFGSSLYRISSIWYLYSLRPAKEFHIARCNTSFQYGAIFLLRSRWNASPLQDQTLPPPSFKSLSPIYS